MNPNRDLLADLYGAEARMSREFERCSTLHSAFGFTEEEGFIDEPEQSVLHCWKSNRSMASEPARIRS